MDGLCKTCGLSMDIDHATFEAEGDESPDTKTVIYHVPIYRCRNPNCRDCGVFVRGERSNLTAPTI